MDQTNPACMHNPLLGLNPGERSALLRDSGMYSPNPETREGIDAFDLRADIRADDLCNTSLRLIRSAVAQMELLAISADLNASHREFVEGICALTRLACGPLGIVRLALSAR